MRGSIYWIPVFTGMTEWAVDWIPVFTGMTRGKRDDKERRLLFPRSTVIFDLIENPFSLVITDLIGNLNLWNDWIPVFTGMTEWAVD